MIGVLLESAPAQVARHLHAIEFPKFAQCRRPRVGLLVHHQVAALNLQDAVHHHQEIATSLLDAVRLHLAALLALLVVFQIFPVALRPRPLLRLPILGILIMFLSRAMAPLSFTTLTPVAPAVVARGAIVKAGVAEHMALGVLSILVPSRHHAATSRPQLKVPCQLMTTLFN